jgi:hypothetical protein
LLLSASGFGIRVALPEDGSAAELRIPAWLAALR